MFTPGGVIQIIDFGLAELKSNKYAPALKFAIPYRPPEVWWNTSRYGTYCFRTDLWSAAYGLLLLSCVSLLTT